MANYLGMAQVQAIRALRSRGWSLRRIGRELGVHRETVARYTRRPAEGVEAPGPPGQNRPNPPTGPHAQNPPTGSDDQNRPNPPTGSGPSSQAEPYREVIIEALARGLSYRRIWQDLQTEHGFAGGYDSVKRFARRLQATRPLPFRRMECLPGEEAQVDFGSGSPIITSDGRRRRTHVFRIVLSHSRKGYSEVVLGQHTEGFIRALENAFHHFGGVPQTLVVDNLKAAVIKADWFDPELNPKIDAFGRHYGTVILPTKPRTPRHKGKIEAGVKYVQANALKGRRFASLEGQNTFLRDWEASVADTRIHGTTRKQVKKIFEEAERPALLPLPDSRFPLFREARRTVHRDGHVEVEKAYYSAPPEYVGRQVWVRWDLRTVRLFDARMEQIAVHVKHEVGRFSTDPMHIASRKISGIERGAGWLLSKVSLIGPHTQQWAEAMVKERGVQGVRVLQGLRSLARRHPAGLIEKACEIAQAHGAYRLRMIRGLIKREASKQEQPALTERHPIIRSLSDYDALVHGAFQEEARRNELFLEEYVS